MTIKSLTQWFALPVLGLAMAAAAGPPAIAADLIYGGSAFGSTAFGPGVNLGRTAVVGLGSATCGVEAAGEHRENSVAGVDAPPILSTGLVATTADSLDAGGVQQAVTTASVDTVSLLDPVGPLPPVIAADAVMAVSASTFDGNAFAVDGSGSGFVNLTVAGLPILDPAVNMEIDLPGIGRVVLNEQIEVAAGDHSRLTVNMIHVFVEVAGDPLGIPTGTEIVVARAASALHSGDVVGLLGGRAYATSVSIGGVVTSGPSAVSSVPCLGGNTSNSLADIDLPPFLGTGLATTTGRGSAGPAMSRAETNAVVEGVDLLGGLVTASAIEARARVVSDGATTTTTDSGSSFVDLVVAGTPILDVDPNTEIPIRGVGTVRLHVVQEENASIRVFMIVLDVEVADLPGIPVGTQIIVGAASANLR